MVCGVSGIVVLVTADEEVVMGRSGDEGMTERTSWDICPLSRMEVNQIGAWEGPCLFLSRGLSLCLCQAFGWEFEPLGVGVSQRTVIEDGDEEKEGSLEENGSSGDNHTVPENMAFLFCATVYRRTLAVVESGSIFSCGPQRLEEGKGRRWRPRSPRRRR